MAPQRDDNNEFLNSREDIEDQAMREVLAEEQALQDAKQRARDRLSEKRRLEEASASPAPAMLEGVAVNAGGALNTYATQPAAEVSTRDALALAIQQLLALQGANDPQTIDNSVHQKIMKGPFWAPNSYKDPGESASAELAAIDRQKPFFHYTGENPDLTKPCKVRDSRRKQLQEVIDTYAEMEPVG